MKPALLALATVATLLSRSASAQITDFCFGDGTATACPCSNFSPLGSDLGCLNALGSGAKLRATGNPSLADDGDGTSSLRLDGTQMTSSFYVYFQGLVQQGAGSGAPFGDGLLCVAGGLIRLHQPRVNVLGASHFPDAGLSDLPISVKGLVTSPGVRNYQCLYRDATIGFCTQSTYNTTNAVEVVWSL